MNYSNFNFPYPVLRKGDDSISGHIDFSVEITEQENNYLVKIDFNIDNEDILELIKSNKAEYSVEMICSDTLFRKIYKTFENHIEFEIIKSEVKGRVSGECLIIAKDNIPSYKNSGAHQDYNDFDIDIEKGNILAYFGGFNFTAHIDYKKLKAVASFMEIIEGEGDTLFVDLDNNKIIIQLPKEDYRLFKQDVIAKEQKFVPIIHSSIVYNSLLIALYNIEEHSDKLWAQAIKYRMEDDENLKDFKDFEKENIPEIAQILLGNPINRLLKQLDENLNIEDED